MTDLDVRLAAYGAAVTRSHRPVDPRAIVAVEVDGVGSAAGDPRTPLRTLERSDDGGVAGRTGTGGRRRRALLAAAASVAIVAGTGLWTQHQSSDHAEPVVIGGTAASDPSEEGVPDNAPPVASPCVAQPADDAPEPAPAPSAPPGPGSSAPVIGPEDEGPQRVLAQYTSPDGDRHLSVTFIPANAHAVDPTCQTPVQFDRPMLQFAWSVTGMAAPAAMYLDPHELSSTAPFDVSPGPVASAGSTSSPNFVVMPVHVQPQVASVQVDVRQQDGSVLAESFPTVRGYAAVIARQRDDVASDLRYYDTAGNLLGTLDRRWFIG